MVDLAGFELEVETALQDVRSERLSESVEEVCLDRFEEPGKNRTL